MYIRDGNKLTPGRPKVRPRLPKGPSKEAKVSEMTSRNRFGDDFWPNRATFTKHAPACTDCISAPPRRDSFPHLFLPEDLQEPARRINLKNIVQMLQLVRRGGHNRSPGTPQMTPRHPKNHPKTSLGSTWAARACFRSSQGVPPR